MQLAKKKELAAKVLKVGKNRVVFQKENLNEIKEAIRISHNISKHRHYTCSKIQ